MKIMVCLISKQHVPNLLSVHAVNPDKLMLLVSRDMEKQAEWFIEALTHGDLNYKDPGRCEYLCIRDQNSIAETKKVLEKAVDKFPGADWTVNLTGGTKPMSIGTYEFFRDKGARMLYIPLSNQNQVIDFSGGAPLTLDHKVSIREFLKGYGFKLNTSDKKIKRTGDRAEKWFKLSTLISANYDKFLDVQNRLHTLKNDQNGAKKGMDIANVDLADNDIRNEIAKTFELKTNDSLLTGRLDKYATKFLTGGWLEIFVCGLLRKFEGSDIWDLHIGINVDKEDLSSSHKVNNEWDVVFMKDQALHIVECKTGEQEQDENGKGTLYKIEAVKNQLGAIKVKSYLATTSSNVVLRYFVWVEGKL